MRRSLPWLLVGLVCLGLAAWLSRDPPAPPKAARQPPSIPLGLRAREHARLEGRRTLPLAAASPSAAPADDDDEVEAAPLRDPVLRALPDAASTVVLEANALRHSAIGSRLVECWSLESTSDLDLVRRMGVDLLEDVDRIAVSDELMVVSGHFAEARWSELLPGSRAERRGDATFLESASETHVAVWGKDLVLVSKDRAALEAAIDRLEGRAPAATRLGEEHTFGEIYGQLAPSEVADLLPESLARVRDTVVRAVSSVELHADAMHDLGLQATLRGKDTEELADLARVFGSAMALGRTTAKATGDEDLAWLLEHALVRQHKGGGFSLELALPFEALSPYLERMCEQRRALDAAMEDGATAED